MGTPTVRAESQGEEDSNTIIIIIIVILVAVIVLAVIVAIVLVMIYRKWKQSIKSAGKHMYLSYLTISSLSVLL